MIPRPMVEFLARASVAVASTRDEQMIPHLHFLSGWSVGDDSRSLVCLVPASFTDGLVDRLLRDGNIAMVAEVIGPHETYQFKGRYLDHRPAGLGDRPIYEACKKRFVDTVQAHLSGRFTDDSLEARLREPAIAVRFAVDEIFIQTPGPVAGRRVFPETR